MKRTLLSLAVSLAACSHFHVARAQGLGGSPRDVEVASTVEAQPASARRAVAALQPLGLFAGILGVEVELRVSQKLSLAVGARYTRYDVKSVEGALWGGSVGLCYFFGAAFSGYYVYPRLQLEHADLATRGERVSGYLLTRAATAGYQWLPGPVSVKLGVGARHTHAAFRTELHGAEAPASGLAPLVDMDLGVVF